jgi:hypothetical protein
MTTSSDSGGGHDWQSPAYVDDWIDRDVTHDEQRQPLLHRAATLLPASGGGPLEVLDVGGRLRRLHRSDPRASARCHRGVA